MLFEKLIVATIAGLFGLLPALTQWLMERGRVRSRRARLDRLRAEVDFLEKCLVLSRQTLEESDSRQLGLDLRRDLERLVAEYRSMVEPDRAEEQKTPRRLSSLRRWFLLYRPETLVGWIVHSLYYFVWLFALALMASGLATSGTRESMSLALGLIVLFGPMILGLQWIGHLQRKRLSDRDAAP